MTTLGWRTTIGLATLLGLVGCATPRGEVLGSYAILRTRPARTLAAADSFLRPGDAPRGFDLTLDAQPPRPIELRAEASDRFGATWRIVEGDLREQFCRVDDEGNVVLCAVIEHADRAISLFRPPLVVAYASLTPGATRTQEVAMRVVDRDRLQRLKEQGTTTQTITLVDEALLGLDGDERWASRIEVEFIARLRQAVVRRQSTVFVVPGRGVYVDESEKTIRVLGLIIRRDREVRVRQTNKGRPLR